MKIAIHTVDCFPGRERLMPFRIAIEAAKGMVKLGVDAHVLNSSVSESNPQDYVYEGIQIIQVPRNFYLLSQYINERKYDAFFFAAAFRDGLKNLSGFKNMNCQKIAYIGSGINPKINATYLAQKFGVKVAKPFLLEAFTPKYLLDKKLYDIGFSKVICLADYTSLRFKKVQSVTIYAGKDNFNEVKSDYSILKKHSLLESRFILFTGAPAPTRGAELLIQAVDKLADDIRNLKVVFLMRTDVGSQYDSFLQLAAKNHHKENIVIIREKVDRNQLRAFMEAAYYVALPFICIPSEIPLTYYEVLSIGTPVLSFRNGGTTECLRDAIFCAGKPSVANLKNAIRICWNNDKKRQSLSEQGLIMMKNHHSWQDMAAEWLELIKK